MFICFTSPALLVYFLLQMFLVVHSEDFATEVKRQLCLLQNILKSLWVHCVLPGTAKVWWEYYRNTLLYMSRWTVITIILNDLINSVVWSLSEVTSFFCYHLLFIDSATEGWVKRYLLQIHRLTVTLIDDRIKDPAHKYLTTLSESTGIKTSYW